MVKTSAPALLVLEDGSAFRGCALGSKGESLGEVVFNTAMVGYQEVLTDPSYARQIVVMTSPHQGNYGTNAEDPESRAVQVAGLAVREASRRASGWRAERTLHQELEAAGVVGIQDVDTRRLTLRIRESGAMRCAISTEVLDPAGLIERVREHPGMAGADLAKAVSTSEAYSASELVGALNPHEGRTFRVAAYDLGIKRNILRLLAAEGCDVTVYPAATPADEILRGAYDGVFFSNGPGDPSVTRYGIQAVAGLLGRVPLFGICLGHQLLGHALGGRTYKMKFGHRGANQPVKNLRTGGVEITSHNHGFAVDSAGWGRADEVAGGAGRAVSHPVGTDGGGGVVAERGWGWTGKRSNGPADPPVVQTGFGEVALTHWNLNDGTLEGLRCLDVAAFSVQYHPEAAPGPHDSRYLFDEFRDLMVRGIP